MKSTDPGVLTAPKKLGRPRKLRPPTLDDPNTIDSATDAYLRADNIVAAINANLPQGTKQLPPIPKDFVLRRLRDREAVAAAIHAAFVLRGGVPAFASWASENPDKFYGSVWAKLLQSDTVTPTGGTQINIISSVPQSPLDLVNVAPNGQVYSIGDDELPE